MKILICLTFLFFSILIFAQQIKYEGNGKIVDIKNQKLSPNEVKKLLAYNPALQKYYSDARDKKVFGNIFLVGGATLVLGDLAIGAFTGTHYPTALTYVGFASMIVSLTIKIGYSKRIEKVALDYNNELISNGSSMTFEKINFITNQNGLGFQITF